LAAPTPLPTLALALPGWCLRAWRLADAPSLARHANNERVWRNLSEAFPHPYTEAIARHWVERGHVDFGGDNWAIAFDDQAVGGCGLQPGQGHERCNCEVGYWLGEPFRSRHRPRAVGAAAVARRRMSAAGPARRRHAHTLESCPCAS